MIVGASPAELNDRVWRELDAQLRPFVAKRVRSETDVDDVLQEVFLRMQRGLPDLRNGQRFGPWVYRVARNAVVDHQRASARHPVAVDEPDQRAAEGDGLDDEPDVQQLVAMYAAFFVSLLPSPYREALTLTELEGLSQREAADMLGISLSCMKSRVQRGRRRLREALEACCHIALDARRRVVSCVPRNGDCCAPGTTG